VFGFVALVVIFRELGIDVQAIVVSAGVVGLAVGLGAQTLIRDVITGVFLLFEGLISVGDSIQVGGFTGTVEAIGLRVTQLRMADGALHIVPNGGLTEFTNFSSGWARVMIDVAVPREVNVDRALEVMRRVGEEWARETGAALDAPRAQGIMRFSGGDVVLRLIVTVDPGHRADADAELRRRIKEAFDRERWSALGVS
jgi:moderate conductance mechanosensitive channel